MMWMDIKIKGKIAVGHIMMAILPLLSRRMQATLQRRYMDWLISAPVQKAWKRHIPLTDAKTLG